MRKSTRLAAALTLASIAPTTGNLPAQVARGVRVTYSTPPAAADTTGGYGAQVWINAGQAAGRRPHPGLPADGFFFLGKDQQNVVVIPSRGLVAVRLGYTPGRDWDLDGFVGRVLDARPAPRGRRHSARQDQHARIHLVR